MNKEDTVQPSPSTDPPEDRIVAIDALRGFDMFWIVGGNGLVSALTRIVADPLPDSFRSQLRHPEWVGFSAWDLIMPLFLFMVGSAMPYSFARRIAEGQKRSDIYGKLVRRSAILFILGMAHQGHLLDFDLSTLHLYCNTLQAIAAGYLIGGMVMLNLRPLGQVVITMGLLVAYWLLMTRVPFYGHPAGTLEPEANLALHVDTMILGGFRDGTTYTWILSSLGFAATTLLGIQAGNILRNSMTSLVKLSLLVMVGASCLAAGWSWSTRLDFPIIKHIWTSSMTLWAAGWSYLLLAVFYALIDVAGFRRWAFPFVVIGANAITAYMAAKFISFGDISGNLLGGFADMLPTALGRAVLSFGAILILWLALYHMYRQKIFVRI